MSWYQTADDTPERTQAPPPIEPGEAGGADTGVRAPRGRRAGDPRGRTTGRTRWLIGAFAVAAIIALLVHATAHTSRRIATTAPMSVTSHVAPTPSGELSPEPAPAVAPPIPTAVPTPREIIPTVPSAPTARPAVLASARRGGTVNVQPAVVVESVPTGSPYSPLITFTVENTGAGVAVLGRITTTDTAFRISRDDCTRIALSPSGMCHITIQFSPQASGRHVGLLVIPIDGSPARTASLRADAT